MDVRIRVDAGNVSIIEVVEAVRLATIAAYDRHHNKPGWWDAPVTVNGVRVGTVEVRGKVESDAIRAAEDAEAGRKDAEKNAVRWQVRRFKSLHRWRT